jgi:light-regulated signal transduction histidine kinase (bacteriophytochrome)
MNPLLSAEGNPSSLSIWGQLRPSNKFEMIGAAGTCDSSQRVITIPECASTRSERAFAGTIMGTGLAISRSIAHSHGGSLVAERRHRTGVRLSLNLSVPSSEV